MERIRKSHLEFDTLLKYLRKLDLSRVEYVYLLHLSRNHTNEGAIVERMHREFPGLPVAICPV